ncbi:hypothetical protein NIES4071_107390 (plasmid) [Calothrix sp. NIES-4071]|nr:hypothetical protein NIES4071_107390 [Calothrix sp. NIES-4071]BAZ64779.1 hypothetical protein NIES4105_105120 [Calothrix sp. NIES-4105]
MTQNNLKIQVEYYTHKFTSRRLLSLFDVWVPLQRRFATEGEDNRTVCNLENIGIQFATE